MLQIILQRPTRQPPALEFHCTRTRYIVQLASERLVGEARYLTRTPLSELQLAGLEVSKAPAKRSRLVNDRSRVHLNNAVPGAPAKSGPPAAARRVKGEREVEIVVAEHVAGDWAVNLVETAEEDRA